MIDLQKASGLPIKVDEQNHLILQQPAVVDNNRRFSRTFVEMAPALLDSELKAPAEITYEVYGGVHLEEDRKKVNDNHLTYDITIIPPIMLGKEYNKTLGHYHGNIPGMQFAHPEIYEVLHGKALFLLQKMDPEFKKLITILAIEAEAGEKVIYPPNYGHIIVNIGKENLITANWISTDYKAMYEPIKEKHGMALYVVKGEDGLPTFIKNKNYIDHPLMRKLNHEDKIRQHFGLDKAEPMYVTAMKNPQVLDFLNNPQKYALEFSSLSS